MVAGKRVVMLLKVPSVLNNTELSKRLTVTVSMSLADEELQDRIKSNIEKIRISEA